MRRAILATAFLDVGTVAAPGEDDRGQPMNDIAQDPPMAPPPLSEAAIAHRRESTLRRMLATPHVPHDALAEMRRIAKPRPCKPSAPRENRETPAQ